MLFAMSFPVDAHVRALQTEIGRPARRACAITAFMYIPTYIVVVVNRLYEASVAVGGRLAGGVEEVLDVLLRVGVSLFA